MKYDALSSWFSKYIRLRDSDEGGYCKCFTCDKVVFWKEIDAGHFVSRRHQNTKFNEYNCHAQCRYCNHILHGNQFVYGIKLDEKYGFGTASQMMIYSRALLKRTFAEKKELQKDFEKRAKELAKQKGIQLTN